ncbi:MAG: polyprenyl synthetase family protein, partial [Bacteroidota bacterium]
VHDDIMDEADLRRGKPSVYKKWNVNTAILSGDVMFADALRQLNTYGTSDTYSKEEYAALNEVFLKSVVIVCEGQALDMEFVKRTVVSENDYLNMIQGKTAALLSGALEMGAITAHADKEQRLALAQFGLDLGIAFQIQDDLLDAIADPEKFGKRPGGDIHEGKKTYLTLLALERADERQKQFIQQTLDRSSSTQDEVDQVLSIMDQLNVMDDIKNKVQQGYDKASERIALFDESDYKQELQHLLTFLQHRDH